MTTLAAKRFATRGAGSLALALSALTVSLAPVASAHADNLNPILGGGLGAIAGAVVGQSVGGHNGAVIGAALGGAAGVTIANDDYRQRYAQQPVYSRTPPVIVQPVQMQPVYVQQQPVYYAVARPYYGYGRYAQEVRYEVRDGWHGGWRDGEHRGWDEHRFDRHEGDHRRD
jgi:hypothetical protein